MVAPWLLADYDAVVPNGADRLFTLVEKQSNHRMSLEKAVTNNNILMERLGWGSATLVVLAGVIGSIALILLGRDITGLAALFTSIAVPAGIFFYKQEAAKRELKKKRENVES